LSYTPVENGYSVGEIILHIAHEEYGEIQYGLTREIAEFPPQFSKDEYQTLQSIQALLAGIHKQTIEYLETLDDTDLDQEFEAQWGETRPLIEFIAHVIEHEIHHRGELSLILGLLGREGLDA
ncbi:MAG: DinB family protein, partial [Anaerolineae bacterium]